MPSIKKQSPTNRSPTPKHSTASGEDLPLVPILDRIRPVDPINVNRMKVSLFGHIGTGKTRLGATFPKPLLILSGSKGTDSVSGVEGIDFVQVYYGRMGDEIGELVEGPIRAGKYATVMVDDLTKMRDIRVAEIMGLGSSPMQKGWGFAGRDEWTECANSLKHILNPLLNLPNTMNLNVIFCSHEADLVEGKSQGMMVNDDDSMIRPCVSSMLGKSLAIWLNGDCNHVCQTFIRPGKEMRTLKDGKGKSYQKEVATGKPQFCLRTQPHELYTIKFRVPLGRPEPPEVIVDPTYTKMVKLIQG